MTAPRCLGAGAATETSLLTSTAQAQRAAQILGLGVSCSALGACAKPGEAHRASGPGHAGARDVISLCDASSIRGASHGTTDFVVL